MKNISVQNQLTLESGSKMLLEGALTTLENYKEEYYLKGKYVEGIALLEKASYVFLTHKDFIRYCECIMAMANGYFPIGHYNIAFSLLMNLLEQYESKLDIEHRASIHRKLGTACLGKDMPNESLLHHQEAWRLTKLLPGEHHKLHIRFQFSVGQIYAYKGDWARALGYLSISQNDAIKHFGKTYKVLHEIYFSMGKCFWAKGDFDRAISYYTQAFYVISMTVSESNPYLTIFFNGIGTCYYDKQDYLVALEYYEKSWSILSKYYDSPMPSMIFSLTGMGNCYFGLKDFRKALIYLEKARDLIDTHYKGHYNLIITNNILIAQCLRKLKQYDKAIALLQKVIQHLDKNSERVFIQYYLQISDCYSEQKQFTTALMYIQKALKCIVPQTIESNIWHTPFVENSDNLQRFFQILNKKITIFWNKYLSTHSDLQNLLTAVYIGRVRSQAFHQLHNSFRVTDSQLSLSQRSANIYDENITISLEAYQKIQQSPKEYQKVRQYIYQLHQLDIEKYDLAFPEKSEDYLKKVFQFSEESKVALLLFSMKESLAKATANIPAELLQQEEDLKIELTFLEKKIQQQNTTVGKSKGGDKQIAKGLLQKLQSKHFEHHKTYVQLIQTFEKDYPDYYQMKYKTQIVSIEEVQASLLEGQWMLNYYMAESRYYIFLIGKEVFEVFDLEKTSGFEQLVEDFLQSIQQHDLESYVEKAHRLYEELIQPVEIYLMDSFEDAADIPQQLIVIPHGILHYVPFEALLCTQARGRYYTAEQAQQRNSSSGYAALDYLLRHFEVSYHYSATLWHYLLKKEEKQASLDGGFVGFAPVYDSESSLEQEEGHQKEDVTERWAVAAKSVRSWAIRSEALRDNGTWTPLPYSKLEAKQIAALFEEKGLIAETFLEKEATKERFRKAVGKSRFLLVAAHGVVNDEHPKLSGLVFYPTARPETSGVEGTIITNNEHPITNSEHPITNNEHPITNSEHPITNNEHPITNSERQTTNNESLITNNESLITNHQHDCILSMEEAYQIPLQADLVVLSSCESGIGKLAKGEGMMAVNRGFLYAGAKNVVSTLFKVYDQPSSWLTQYLFEGVLEGKSCAAALRAAKLRLLELEEVDVKSWSGFVLIGGK